MPANGRSVQCRSHQMLNVCQNTGKTESTLVNNLVISKIVWSTIKLKNRRDAENKYWPLYLVAFTTMRLEVGKHFPRPRRGPARLNSFPGMSSSMYKNKVWVDNTAKMINFTFRAGQKWGPIWETFGHSKSDGNPKQKIGKTELMFVFGKHQFLTENEKTSSPHPKFKLRRRAPQIKQNEPCALKEENLLYHKMKHSFHKLSLANLLSNTIMQGTWLHGKNWHRHPSGSAASIKNNEQAHLVLNVRWFCGRS